MIRAFVLFLLCCAPHPVLGFPTGLYPVGFEGRIHYIFGSAGDRVKPFLISRAVPVSFFYGGLALFDLPLGVTVAVTD